VKEKEPMDIIDKKLFEDLSGNIDIPSKLNRIIREALYKDENEEENIKPTKDFRIIKAIAAVSVGIILTTGIVFAGIITYEKVLKKPKTYNSIQEELKEIPKEPTREEKKELMSQEEAISMAQEVMSKLGYGKQHISKIELKRGYDSEYNCYYVIKTEESYEEGLEININANTGKFNFFIDRDLKYKKISPDTITKQKAEEIAKEICSKFGFLKSDYELESVEEQIEYFNSAELYKWQAKFSRKYDDIYNPYEGARNEFYC
jgi:hypothetical protein